MADNIQQDKGNILEVTKTDQYRTIKELFAGSKPNSSYYTLLILSTIIITSGLILGNSPIVIGGMLVTPLLTPILLVGLGLAVGEINIAKNVASIMGKSFTIVIVGSFLLSVMFGQPSSFISANNTLVAAILYFIVALASGIAGAFAWAKKELSETLPGIAIAVSIVPPLSLMGIWLSVWEFDAVRFYFSIFLANLIGIILGSLLVFSLLKFYKLEEEMKKQNEQSKAGGA